MLTVRSENQKRINKTTAKLDRSHKDRKVTPKMLPIAIYFATKREPRTLRNIPYSSLHWYTAMITPTDINMQTVKMRFWMFH